MKCFHSMFRRIFSKIYYDHTLRKPLSDSQKESYSTIAMGSLIGRTFCFIWETLGTKFQVDTPKIWFCTEIQYFFMLGGLHIVNRDRARKSILDKFHIRNWISKNTLPRRGCISQPRQIHRKSIEETYR